MKQTKDPEAKDFIDPKELEAAIVAISKVMKQFDASNVDRRVIELLIKDSTVAIKMAHIETVLDVLPELEERYLTKKGKS